jgi:hypothetical protein
LAIYVPAQASQMRWSGVVFACSPPLEAKVWGDGLCDLLAEHLADEGKKLDVPVARALVGDAGPDGHPIDGKVSFAWPAALRILPVFEKTGNIDYPWSMTVSFYEHTADAGGEYSNDRWKLIYGQGFTLVGGNELGSSKEVVPFVLRGLLGQIFAPR